MSRKATAAAHIFAATNRFSLVSLHLANSIDIQLLLLLHWRFMATAERRNICANDMTNSVALTHTFVSPCHHIQLKIFPELS